MHTAFRLFLLGHLAAATPSAPVPDTVVVCPAPFRAAMRPWIAHRERDGHGIVMIDPAESAESTRQNILRIHAKSPIRFVMIVGDVPGPAIARQQAVPTFSHPAPVTRAWGGDPEIPSDTRYADFDGDGTPDVAIGRLPADSTAEVTQTIEKILRYETASANGSWQHRINFVAGVGGFTPLIDSLLEGTTRRLIESGIPAGFRTTMTYASWRSPFCPDPRSFRDCAIRRLNEGCLLWVYMGHGSQHQLDWIRVPGGVAPILGTNDVARVHTSAGSPIAVFLSCHAGNYQHPDDCIAERLLQSPSGPVAVIAGSGVTLPYGMAVLGHGMLDECFSKQTRTLGEILLHAKRRSVSQNELGLTRTMLDTFARMASPQPQRLDEELREHLMLIQLLGDPLLRVRHPQSVYVTAAERATPGSSLEVTFQTELPGTATVELVCCRGLHVTPVRYRNRFDNSDEGMKQMNRDYESANEDRWSTVVVEAQSGTVRTNLEVPEQASGQCYVRVCLQSPNDFAVGATKVNIMPARLRSAAPKN